MGRTEGAADPNEEEGDLSSGEHEDAIADRIRTRSGRTAGPRTVRVDPAMDLELSAEDESEPEQASPVRTGPRRTAGRTARRTTATTGGGAPRGRGAGNKPPGKKKKKKYCKG